MEKQLNVVGVDLDPLKREMIAISEVFGVTIQGEGALIGRPTVFVRTGGCDFRCSWCDSLYAVLIEHKDEWAMESPGEVLARIRELSPTPILVTLSGGNPALQPLGPLIEAGHEQGHTFTMETQGTVYRDWMAKLDYLVISPKPPSSGMPTQTDRAWERLKRVVDGGPLRTSLKVVVFDDVDYAYARAVGERFPMVPLYLQVGNHTPPNDNGEGAIDTAGIMDRLRWLVDKVIADRWYAATVLPQLHTLIWANKRGV